MTSDEPTGNVVTITVSMAAAEAIADLSNLVFDATLVAANDIMVINNNVATNLTLSGSDLIDQFTGGSGNDTMTGGAGADVINAAAGNNTVDGGAGADIIDTTTGTDTITGGDGADIVRSGAAVDTITLGEGADIVASGGGGDIINLTETTSAIDVVQIVALTDGSAAGTIGGTFTGFDVVTGFTIDGTADDLLVFDTGVSNANMGNDTVDGAVATVNAKGVHAGTAANGTTNDITATNYTSADAVVNFYNDAGSGVATNNTGVDIIAVTMGSGTGAFSAVYALTDDNGTLDATEVMLLGTVDATLTTAEIIIA
jgi:hypothetical protein